MLPRIKISRDCNYRISGELMRVFPREGIIIPLVSLNLRDNDANPCKVVRLSDVAEVVVADAVLVPRDRQVNGMARVSVLPNTDGPVNAEVERLTRRFPRLRPCAYLHSHPFAVGRTWPSRGPRCDYEGHMLPLLARNRQAGLETCFSFIACRSVDGSGWRIQCFALDNDEQIVDLGCAETVPNGSTEIRRALAPPLGERSMVRRIVARWHEALDDAAVVWRCDELFDGWHRFVIEAAANLSAVVLVPIDFPCRSPRVFAVQTDSGRTHAVEQVTQSWVGGDALIRAVHTIKEAYGESA